MVVQQGWLVTSGVTYMAVYKEQAATNTGIVLIQHQLDLFECVCLEVYKSLVRFEKGWGLVLCFC